MDKEAKQEYIRTRIKAIKEMAEEIGNLEAESEKPELRHGDYGIDEYKNFFICFKPRVKKLKTEFILYQTEFNDGNEGRFISESEYADGFIILGNIFDDLGAYAEDIQEFRKLVYGGGHISLKIHNFYKITGIQIKIGEETASMEMCEAAEFHRKLGAMLATAKRKARDENKI